VIDACDECLCRSHLIAYLAADPARLRDVDGDPQAGAFVRRFDARRAREKVEALAVHAACAHSDRLPAGLRDLTQPPAVLYSTAPFPVANEGEPAAVLIGSRRPSEYGRTVAYGLGRGLGASGVAVVSGLALGIDAIAHRGCLDGHGRTVAVLACGVDVPYPRTNRALYERIKEFGAVVSEMPPGARPRRWLFPARNRIMAALGQLTVVVEAAERSGTLITADCAAELGRDVAAVPGRVTSGAAVGTNGLLRNGAALVTGAQDVLDLLYGVGARSVPSEPAPALDPVDARVLEAVSRGGGLDEIGASLGLGAASLRASLARLERLGLVRRAASGGYIRTA
jgi:DNA processing protein